MRLPEEGVWVSTRVEMAPEGGREIERMMRYDQQFGLFEDGEAGPLWRGFFASLDEAKLHAQALADKEGQAFFIFNLKESSEVARLHPMNYKPAEHAGRS